MTNLDRLLSRDITLLTKVCIVKAMVFPVIMYRRGNWTIKKAEHAFELWCWRILLRVPWTRRSNQSILKKINPEYSLEGLLLKLKHQCFGHLMWRADSLEKTLMVGKTGGRRRRGQQRTRCQMASLTQWMWVWSSCGRWRRTGKEGWRAAVHGATKSWTRLRDWTELNLSLYVYSPCLPYTRSCLRAE